MFACQLIPHLTSAAVTRVAFDLEITSGPLVGQSFPGEFAYDSELVVEEVYNQLAVTSFDFMFQGHHYNEVMPSETPTSLAPDVRISDESIGGLQVHIFGLNRFGAVDRDNDIGFNFEGVTPIPGSPVRRSSFIYGYDITPIWIGDYFRIGKGGEGEVSYRLVPEPSNFALLTFGFAAIGCRRRRRV
jgi:hypothetical protein